MPGIGAAAEISADEIGKTTARGDRQMFNLQPELILGRPPDGRARNFQRRLGVPKRETKGDLGAGRERVITQHT